MKIVDVGSGPPIVVIPGIQGRWEWMRPGIEALAASQCRVVTFSLCDEPSAQAHFDERRGFDCYVEQVREALDQVNLESAVICGVSFGGPIATAFAECYPARTRALVLVSALSPRWSPDQRMRMYLRAPRLFALAFLMGAARRAQPEIAAAFPTWRARMAFNCTSTLRAVLYRPVASRMGRRVRLLLQARLREVSKVRAPVLLVTGEPALDRAVPVTETRRYMELFPHARLVTLPRTGHVGIVTRPGDFADVVAPFVLEHGG